MNKSQKKTVSILLVLAVAATAGYMYFGAVQASNPPVTPPPTNTDTDGDGTPDTAISFSMFQALKLTYLDSSTAWKFPSSRTTLNPLTIFSDGKSVSTMQANVYFTLASSKPVSQVTFTCEMSLAIYNGAILFKDLTNGYQGISKVVSNPENATDVLVTYSSMTNSEFQALLIPPNVQYDLPLTYNVKVRDITANVVFSDGTAKTFGLTGVQATANQLWWDFRLLQSGTVMQVVDLNTRWSWT